MTKNELLLTVKNHINGTMGCLNEQFMDRDDLTEKLKVVTDVNEKAKLENDLAIVYHAIYCLAATNEGFFALGKEMFPDQAHCFDDLSKFLKVYGA